MKRLNLMRIAMLIVTLALFVMVSGCDDDGESPIDPNNRKSNLENVKKEIVGKWHLTSASLMSSIPTGSLQDEEFPFVFRIPRTDTIMIEYSAFTFNADGSMISQYHSEGSMSYGTYEVREDKPNKFIIATSHDGSFEINIDLDYYEITRKKMYINSFYYLHYFYQKNSD